MLTRDLVENKLEKTPESQRATVIDVNNFSSSQKTQFCRPVNKAAKVLKEILTMNKYTVSLSLTFLLNSTSKLPSPISPSISSQLSTVSILGKHKLYSNKEQTHYHVNEMEKVRSGKRSKRGKYRECSTNTKYYCLTCLPKGFAKRSWCCPSSLGRSCDKKHLKKIKLQSQRHQLLTCHSLIIQLGTHLYIFCLLFLFLCRFGSIKNIIIMLFFKAIPFYEHKKL